MLRFESQGLFGVLVDANPAHHVLRRQLGELEMWRDAGKIMACCVYSDCSSSRVWIRGRLFCENFRI